jgi:hypothetical protein
MEIPVQEQTGADINSGNSPLPHATVAGYCIQAYIQVFKTPTNSDVRSI